MNQNQAPARVTARLDGFTSTLVNATDAEMARAAIARVDYYAMGYTHVTVEVRTERGWVGIG